MATNGLDNMEAMAKAAYYEASLAAIVIPNAWSMVAIIYCAQSNPGELWDAADDWYEVKQRLVAADKAVTEQLRSLTDEGWEGRDRQAFEAKLNDYQNQIRVSYTFAVTVHVILKLVALLIATFIMVMWAFATILAVYAAIIVVLMAVCAVPAGALAFGATLVSMRTQATVMAGQLYVTLKQMNKALEAVFSGCAATLAGLMVVDVQAQLLTGNTDAYGDFLKGTVNSADDVIKGRLALLEQNLTANFMGGKNILGGLSGKSIAGVNLPRHLPQHVRPFVGPAAGAKGWGDVGFDLNPGGDPKEDWRDRDGGSPSLTRPVTGATKYGDSYVDRTNPLANAGE